MKSFKTLLLALILSVVAMPAFAQTVASVNPCENLAEATRGKNQSDVNAILAACRTGSDKVSKLVENISVPEPEEVSEWAAASKGFAEALGIAAKELGIAVNDFLNSPAGILLALILLYNFAGGALLGLPFTMFTLWLFTRILSAVRTDKIEYETVPMLWGMFTVRRKTRVITENMHENESITLVLSGIGLLILNLIVWMHL